MAARDMLLIKVCAITMDALTLLQVPPYVWFTEENQPLIFESGIKLNVRHCLSISMSAI
jgi:hypothetical protein